MYDYGARNYDPALGRWMNIDPLAEKYNGEGPYIYCSNDPIAYLDPDGRDRIYSASGRLIEDTGSGKKLLVRIGNNDLALSKLDYSNKGTACAVSRIIANEAKALGYNGYYGVKKMDRESTIAHTNSKNSVFFNTTQLKKGSGDNFYDMKSTLRHEADQITGHKDQIKIHLQVMLEYIWNKLKQMVFMIHHKTIKTMLLQDLRAIKAQAEGQIALAGMVKDFNLSHEGYYNINYKINGQNYSNFTVIKLKTNQSQHYEQEQIY